jgi:hypothetical protein
VLIVRRFQNPPNSNWTLNCSISENRWSNTLEGLKDQSDHNSANYYHKLARWSYNTLMLHVGRAKGRNEDTVKFALDGWTRLKSLTINWTVCSWSFILGNHSRVICLYNILCITFIYNVLLSGIACSFHREPLTWTIKRAVLICEQQNSIQMALAPFRQNFICVLTFNQQKLDLTFNVVVLNVSLWWAIG